MGCIARLGCLLLLLCLLALGWLTRDRWLRVIHLGSSPATASVVWEPLTPQRAERARRTLQRLGQPTGPVFANLTGGEAASYVYGALANGVPRAADSAEAAVIGDRLYLRASMPVRELGGPAVLGPLASLLGDRERVQFGGTFSIVRPGLAQFEVQDIRVRDLQIPRSAIPRILRGIERGARPSGMASDGLPLVIPTYIGDVRLARGRVTLYKSVGGE